LGITERVSLFEMVTEGTIDPGGPVELSVLSVSELGDDGLVRRQEWYSPEQRDEALARFDELAHVPEHDHLVNDASRKLSGLYDAMVRGDFDAIAAGTADDAVIDDRRRVLGYCAEGLDAVMSYTRSVYNAGVREVVAV